MRQGQGGQSTSQQQNTVSIPANQTIDLTRLSLNIDAGDTVKITVTVSDGNRSFIAAVVAARQCALIIQ
jgi:curli production protein